MVAAIADDMKAKLSMAPGGAWTAQSLEFIQESARGVIAEKVRLLQDSKSQSCNAIIAALVADVERLNGKLASDRKLESFIDALGEALDQATDALNAVGARSPREARTEQTGDSQHSRRQPEEQQSNDRAPPQKPAGLNDFH